MSECDSTLCIVNELVPELGGWSDKSFRGRRHGESTPDEAEVR